MTFRAATALAVAVLAGGTVLSACASSPSSPGSTDGRLSIATSFYPIAFATEQIAGDHAKVTSLTKPGAEPHDMELSARQVTDLRKADLLVYARGFQPALDDATDLLDPGRLVDVAPAADLTLSTTSDGHDHTHAPSEGGDQAGGSNGKQGAIDPHFWLDPERYAAVAEAIGARLERDDPSHAVDYATNTKAFVARLVTLDEQFRTGLAHCSIKQLVTSHAAFGYLAARYGLTQEGITGVSPDVEPSAAALAAITELVRHDGVTTIYQETLVEPHFAQVVAGETGAKVATLDPLEGITKASAGSDYFEVMQANLAVLEKGQNCS